MHEYENLCKMKRPVRCPGCQYLVMRDKNVVDNKVICPNKRCEVKFCWICLDKAHESKFQMFDHFGELNFAHCPGSLYFDIRDINCTY